MKDKILKEINLLESSRNIKILFASESGSRAWGFPSPDSDYDVRFFYVKPIDWYLSLNESKDTIDLGVNELLDINGWEIKKAMRLMKKSNMSPLEWINSTIIYYESNNFRKTIESFSNQCFSPIASMHHYLSMAKRFFDICNGEESVKLKSWFYGLRASLNCKWILEKDSIPPIQFRETLKSTIRDKTVVNKILNLIDLKATKDENFLFKKDEALLLLMKNCIENSQLKAKTLRGNTVDNINANNLFRSFIHEF